MELQTRFCTSADGTRIAYATLGTGRPLVSVIGWGFKLETAAEQSKESDWTERLGRVGCTYASIAAGSARHSGT